MINCVVIDDEPLACKLIESYIGKTKFLVHLKTFSNPIEAVQYIKQSDTDLIFLDVQMPELTGIQFLKILDKKYSVILTTAYENYALESYDYDVVDYLLKPIEYDRFYIAVNKLLKYKNDVELPVSQNKNYIFVKSEYRTIRIELSEILFLEGFGDYVIFHTKTDKIYTLERLKNCEEKLPSDKFMRVHKSYIIALDKIDFIERNEVEINKQKIPIGDTYKKQFWSTIK